MAKHVTNEFHVSVKTLPSKLDKKLFTPFVSITAGDEQEPLVSMITSQAFTNAWDAERYGMKWGSNGSIAIRRSGRK
jgi:hypothetical protein